MFHLIGRQTRQYKLQQNIGEEGKRKAKKKKKIFEETSASRSPTRPISLCTGCLRLRSLSLLTVFFLKMQKKTTKNNNSNNDNYAGLSSLILPTPPFYYAVSFHFFSCTRVSTHPPPPPFPRHSILSPAFPLPPPPHPSPHFFPFTNFALQLLSAKKIISTPPLHLIHWHENPVH